MEEAILCRLMPLCTRCSCCTVCSTIVAGMLGQQTSDGTSYHPALLQGEGVVFLFASWTSHIDPFLFSGCIPFAISNSTGEKITKPGSRGGFAARKQYPSCSRMTCAGCLNTQQAKTLACSRCHGLSLKARVRARRCVGVSFILLSLLCRSGGRWSPSLH